MRARAEHAPSDRNNCADKPIRVLIGSEDTYQRGWRLTRAAARELYQALGAAIRRAEKAEEKAEKEETDHEPDRTDPDQQPPGDAVPG